MAHLLNEFRVTSLEERMQSDTEGPSEENWSTRKKSLAYHSSWTRSMTWLRDLEEERSFLNNSEDISGGN